MFPKELVNYQDKLYSVYKKLKPHQIIDSSINDMKDLWRCDVVVRSKQNNDDTLFFLRLIEDAEIVRDLI
jgi:hypothetical protein